MARMHAHPRFMGPKMDSISLRYFGLRPCETASSRPLWIRQTDTKGVEARSVVPAVWSATRASRFFSLFLSPSPSSNGRLLHLPKRNATTEQLGARAECNGYKRGALREKDSTRDNGKYNKKTKRSQNSVLDRYVS